MLSGASSASTSVEAPLPEQIDRARGLRSGGGGYRRLVDDADQGSELPMVFDKDSR
jgi:hypothetical protein